MTWAKLDDRAWSNEKLLSLSHEAFRLWIAALSLVAQGWPASEGCLTRARAEGLAQWHHIADPTATIDELAAKKCWEKRPHGLLHVHDIEEFLPDAELSAKRAAAGRRGGKASQRNGSAQASASDLLEQTSSTPRARVPTRPDPSRPDQLTTLSSESVAAAPAVVDSESPAGGVQAIVGAYVDACLEAGAAAVSNDRRGRIGKAVKALLGAGHDTEALLAGVRDLARRNASPSLLEDIVGDVERVRAGTPIGRVMPPRIAIGRDGSHERPDANPPRDSMSAEQRDYTERAAAALREQSRAREAELGLNADSQSAARRVAHG